jgi:hypothetical protein
MRIFVEIEGGSHIDILVLNILLAQLTALCGTHSIPILPILILVAKGFEAGYEKSHLPNCLFSPSQSDCKFPPLF